MTAQRKTGGSAPASGQAAGSQATPTGSTATASARWPESPTQKATILIIDDDDGVRHFMRDALQEAGFDTVEARNGYDGLERYRLAPTDAVITDLVMPEAGGREVILELTWATPAAKILAISGQSGDPNFLAVAEKFGACRTLVKPFTRDQLIQVVTAALEEQRKHSRFHVNLPTSFRENGKQGSGRIVNISRGGCAVESAAPMQPGSYVNVRLNLPGREDPLTVDLAAVRWATGSSFGVEFIRIASEVQQALRHYLQSMYGQLQTDLG